MNKKLLFLFFLIIILLLRNLESQEFPIPQDYYSWINFWIKVFSQYSSDEIIYFDKRCPEAIIAVLKIEEDNTKELKNLKTIKNDNAFEYFYRIKKDKKYVEFIENPENLKNSYKKCGITNVNNIKMADLMYQRGNRDKIKYGIIRSGLYKELIQSILKENGIPSDLYLLPLIESSYWHFAYSKAGALGIWQFIKSTGRIYGLEINEYIDERIDIIKSTKAAAKLLKFSYSKLGQWDLAITAYNYGLQGMLKAVNATGTKDFQTILKKHKNKRFKFASRNFYFEFLAIRIIMSNLKKYFPEIEPFSSISFKLIKIEKDTPINILIKEIGIDKQIFKIYNPAYKAAAFKKNIILKNGTEVYLPINQGTGSELTYLNIEDRQNIIDLAKKVMTPVEHIIALNSMNEKSFWKRNINYLVILK